MDRFFKLVFFVVVFVFENAFWLSSFFHYVHYTTHAYPLAILFFDIFIFRVIRYPQFCGKA